VYFIGRSTNRDRFCFAPQKPTELRSSPAYKGRDFYELQVVINKKVWKLLCICSEQVFFDKAQLKWYSASPEALNRGRALPGEWKEVDGPLDWSVLERRVAF
jgi:hypothetical protein